MYTKEREIHMWIVIFRRFKSYTKTKKKKESRMKK